MPTYSNAYEKEEIRHMNSGLWRTFYALLLCWVPVLGLTLAISAFWTQAVRMTEKHKKRLFVYTALAVIMVIVCLTALLGEIYLYTQKPDVLTEWKDKIWGMVATDDQQDEYGIAGEEDYGGLGLYDDGTSDADYYMNDDGTYGENDEDFSVPDEYYGEDDNGDTDENTDDGFYYDPADEYTGDEDDEYTGDEYDYGDDFEDGDMDDGLSTEAPDKELQQAIYDDYKAGASAFGP